MCRQWRQLSSSSITVTDTDFQVCIYIFTFRGSLLSFNIRAVREFFSLDSFLLALFTVLSRLTLRDFGLSFGIVVWKKKKWFHFMVSSYPRTQWASVCIHRYIYRYIYRYSKLRHVHVPWQQVERATFRRYACGAACDIWLTPILWQINPGADPQDTHFTLGGLLENHPRCFLTQTDL